MNTYQNEVWKNIVGYEGLYQISNLGRIKYLHRERDNGGSYPEKITTGSLDSYGYRRTCLTKNGNRKDKKIHQLVAMHFVHNPKNLKFINHKDGNKENNAFWNLEWTTRSENNYHAYRVLGKNLKGSKNGRSTISEEQAIKAKRQSVSVETDKALAKEFNTRWQNIQNIRLGLTWKHI